MCKRSVNLVEQKASLAGSSIAPQAMIALPSDCRLYRLPDAGLGGSCFDR